MSEWHQLAGIVGTTLIVVSYLLLQLGRVSGTQLSYSVMNAVGASLLVVSLLYSFNLGAFVVECFWAVISVGGIIRCLYTKPQPAS